MQRHTQVLKTGWFMKEHGVKPTIDSYLPVKQVPSQVHIDLLANNMCVTIYTNRRREILTETESPTHL